MATESTQCASVFIAKAFFFKLWIEQRKRLELPKSKLLDDFAFYRRTMGLPFSPKFAQESWEDISCVLPRLKTLENRRLLSTIY